MSKYKNYTQLIPINRDLLKNNEHMWGNGL